MTVHTVQDVADGAMLGGKYRIRRVLGQGGMGVVVEALHVELDDRVAIKFLTPRALTEPDAVQRFVREAKAAVRLRSEHIARVRDVGLLPGGDPYIVMEYLDGVELRALFSGPRLAPSALVDLILQACEGLAEAHSIGIVHRDIKPSNLFVIGQIDGMPHVKVLDFGVSKVPLDDLHLTGTNSWMGTPAYMSPEQMRSTKNVDARSDLWSLAVVLYEGLEGRLPFPGDSLADLLVNVTTMPPEPLTERTPPALGAVVMRCLEKSPAARFENMAAFAEAIAPFAETTHHAAMIVERTRRLLAAPRARTGPVAAVSPITPAAGVAIVETTSGTGAPRATPPRKAMNADVTEVLADPPGPGRAVRAAVVPVAAPGPSDERVPEPIDEPARAPISAPITEPIDDRSDDRIEDPIVVPRARPRLLVAVVAAVVVLAILLVVAVPRLRSAEVAPAAALERTDRAVDAALVAVPFDAPMQVVPEATLDAPPTPLDAAPVDARASRPARDADRANHHDTSPTVPDAATAPPLPIDAAPAATVTPPDAPLDPLGRRI